MPPSLYRAIEIIAGFERRSINEQIVHMLIQQIKTKHPSVKHLIGKLLP